jgi:hypothetical protein
MREGSAVAAEGELVFWVTDEARRGHSFIPRARSVIPRAFRGPTGIPGYSMMDVRTVSST